MQNCERVNHTSFSPIFHLPTLDWPFQNHQIAFWCEYVYISMPFSPGETPHKINCLISSSTRVFPKPLKRIKLEKKTPMVFYDNSHPCQVSKRKSYLLENGPLLSAGKTLPSHFYGYRLHFFSSHWKKKKVIEGDVRIIFRKLETRLTVEKISRGWPL